MAKQNLERSSLRSSLGSSLGDQLAAGGLIFIAIYFLVSWTNISSFFLAFCMGAVSAVAATLWFTTSIFNGGKTLVRTYGEIISRKILDHLSEKSESRQIIKEGCDHFEAKIFTDRCDCVPKAEPGVVPIRKAEGRSSFELDSDQRWDGGQHFCQFCTNEIDRNEYDWAVINSLYYHRKCLTTPEKDSIRLPLCFVCRSDIYPDDLHLRHGEKIYHRLCYRTSKFFPHGHDQA